MKGFTLIEILVASIIGVFVAVVAVGTLKAVSVNSERISKNINKAAEIRFASKRITADLVNLYRDRDLRNVKFVGTIQDPKRGGGSWLTFYTVSRVKARASQPEGDVYEVEYYLVKNQDKNSLMRQLWPNPDKDSEPGGILTVIAEGIDVFDVRYFDGQEWKIEWSEEERRLPELVEVAMAAKEPSGTRGVMESFIINFSRSRGGQIDTFEFDEGKESAISDEQ